MSVRNIYTLKLARFFFNFHGTENSRKETMLAEHKYQQKYLPIWLRYRWIHHTKSSTGFLETITDILQWSEKKPATEVDILANFCLAVNSGHNQRLEKNEYLRSKPISTCYKKMCTVIQKHFHVQNYWTFLWNYSISEASNLRGKIYESSQTFRKATFLTKTFSSKTFVLLLHF